MLSALAAAVLALLPSPGGLPGDTYFVSPQDSGAPAYLKAAESYTSLRQVLRAVPPIVPVQGSDPDRLSEFDFLALPLHMGLEQWHGTLCFKGAWTLRASEDELLPGLSRALLWQLQISPAVLEDGARLGPGIGASSHF